MREESESSLNEQFFETELGVSERVGMPTSWAMTDLVFLLLIIFVLGVTVSSAHEVPLQVDTAQLDGESTPFYGKQLLVEVTVKGTPSVRQQFLFSLRSRPEIAPPLEFELESRDELAGAILELEQRVLELQELHPEYFVRRTLVSPGEGTYGEALQILATLQESSHATWLAAASGEFP